MPNAERASKVGKRANGCGCTAGWFGLSSLGAIQPRPGRAEREEKANEGYGGGAFFVIACPGRSSSGVSDNTTEEATLTYPANSAMETGPREWERDRVQNATQTQYRMQG